jgi:predicted dinucleotide-binding enzyme
LAQADALVLATPWPAYREVHAPAPGKRDLVVVDADRFLQAWRDAPGVCYVAVGSPAREAS